LVISTKKIPIKNNISSRRISDNPAVKRESSNKNQRVLNS